MYTTCSALLPALSATSYKNKYRARDPKSTSVTRQLSFSRFEHPQCALYDVSEQSLFSLVRRNTRVTIRVDISLSWESHAFAIGKGHVSMVVEAPAGHRADQSWREFVADGSGCCGSIKVSFRVELYMWLCGASPSSAEGLVGW